MKLKKKDDPGRLVRRVQGILRAVRAGDYEPDTALRAIDDTVYQETGERPVLAGWVAS